MCVFVGQRQERSTVAAIPTAWDMIEIQSYCVLFQIPFCDSG